jgi:hypothetical protein
MTLADVAARCSPPTTAQTIGRLETGTRNLSLIWMNRIALALEVDPELLVRGDASEQAKMVARLTDVGAEALTTPRDAILPTELVGEGTQMAMSVETGAGDYRSGDQIWLRQMQPEHFSKLVNRDVLAPRRWPIVFGRLIDRDEHRIHCCPRNRPSPVGDRQSAVACCCRNVSTKAAITRA